MLHATLVRIGTEPVARLRLVEAIRAHAGDVNEVPNRELADRVITISLPDTSGRVVVHEQGILHEESEPLVALASRVCDGPA